MRRMQEMDHLTRDVLAAQAAGMSYGKWKAMHPHTVDLEAIVIDTTPPVNKGGRSLVCCECGETYIASGRYSGRKYCSEECKIKAGQRRYYAQRVKRDRRCSVCGWPIDGNGGRRYSSAACKLRAHRERCNAKKAEQSEVPA